MGKWNGIDYQPEYKSTGGCSSLGVDSEGKFGLVYKATESSGGIYRYATDEFGQDYHDYMYPLHFNEIPEYCKYIIPQFLLTDLERSYFSEFIGKLKIIVLVTNDEPVLGTASSGNCYLVMSEYCNNPSINRLCTGIITFDDKFESLLDFQESETLVI